MWSTTSLRLLLRELLESVEQLGLILTARLGHGFEGFHDHVTRVFDELFLDKSFQFVSLWFRITNVMLDNQTEYPERLNLSTRIIIVKLVVSRFVCSPALAVPTVISLALSRATAPRRTSCFERCNIGQLCWRRYGSLNFGEVVDQAVLCPCLVNTSVVPWRTDLWFWTCAYHILKF